jgi:hypothetical protein
LRASVLAACVVLAGCGGCDEPAPKRAVPPAPKTLSSALLGLDGRTLANAKPGADLDFAAIVGARALENGMQLKLEPDEPHRLGVHNSTKGYDGQLELFARAVEADEGELDAFYYRFARDLYRDLEAERAKQDEPGKQVVGDEPRLVRMGELRGVRYAHSELHDGTLVDRAFGYAFVQGGFLYGITGWAPAGKEADSSFKTLQDLAAFEADAPALLDSLQLPVR